MMYVSILAVRAAVPRRSFAVQASAEDSRRNVSFYGGRMMFHMSKGLHGSKGIVWVQMCEM